MCDKLQWRLLRICFVSTSSNFCAIMEKALKMPSVGPVMVTILSGDDPSDMLIRAPLWKHKSTIIPASICCHCSASAHKLYTNAHLLPHFLDRLSFLSGRYKTVGLISFIKRRKQDQLKESRKNQ